MASYQQLGLPHCNVFNLLIYPLSGFTLCKDADLKTTDGVNDFH